ncbi:MAG: head-tail connector protein [Holosporaceae bacterium]|jgi:hypothetical protein|nr:head-tail connector protein [Holosporaceae bacterium]
MDLCLIEGPQSEIISLKEAKNYLHIDHNFDDDLILMLIKSTREAIEAITQKTLLQQTWKYTIYGGNAHIVAAPNDNYPCMARGSNLQIPLPKPPIIKILKVSVNDIDIEEQCYALDKTKSKFCLLLTLNKSLQRSKSKIISILYKAGIAANADNVPYTIKLANLMMMANSYQERYSYLDGSVVSNGVRQLLAPFLNLRVF